MWRRFAGAKEPTIGSPYLFETSVDEGYLETIPEVESIISRQNSVAAASITTRQSVAPSLATLPELPFRAVPPLNAQVTGRQRSSSLYSNPSPELPPKDLRLDTSKTYHAADCEVSPLNSPNSFAEFTARGSHCVSPIEEPPSNQSLNTTSQPKSKIPQRKAVASAGADSVDTTVKVTTPASASERQETKWDDYSGEPTTSENGKPSSVRPGQDPLEVQFPQLKERTRQILAGIRDREIAKRKAVGSQPQRAQTDPLDNPIQKEPWKGASGRTTLLEPVQDNPSARLAPLQIPRKEPAQSPSSSHSPDHMESTIRPMASQDSIKPVVPLKLGNHTPRVLSPMTYENSAVVESPFQTPQLASVPDAYYAATSPVASPTAAPEQAESPADEEGPQTPTTPTQDQPMLSAAPNSHGVQVMDAEQDASSRFSWTTYATTVNESPPRGALRDRDESPIPPVPTIQPIIVRKRPPQSHTDPYPISNKSAMLSNESVVTRKPVAAVRARAASVMTHASLSKSLPQCPPELEAADKISTLEARMEDLARRRGNITKIIRQLSDALSRNAIVYTTQKRAEVEKTIAKLNLELDEVLQEEHEVGIRQHRAKKRRDKDDNYEQPTALWIKRVTS